MKRRFLFPLSLAFALGAAGLAPAQDDYASRPIRIIVPLAAGGGTDVLARVSALKLPGVCRGQPNAGLQPTTTSLICIVGLRSV